MKIVINRCHGGFGLSKEAEDLYKQRANITNRDWYYHDLDRSDPILCQIVEELGEKADTNYSELAIVEIPDGVDWQIEEYGGREWIAEVHRTWR